MSCNRKRSAFSLVELIVVMVILGMLAGLVAIRTRGFLISSKQNAAKAEIANIVKALESFYASQGRYPTTDEGIEVLAQRSEAWPEPFLNKLPKDPWKNPYEYISPGASEPYEVICLGADGREGGEGEDQDFSSVMLDEDA
ncbi:MAG: type II secretion system major pseudopilin GspG [Planctomycetota bacterium]